MPTHRPGYLARGLLAAALVITSGIAASVTWAQAPRPTTPAKAASEVDDDQPEMLLYLKDGRRIQGVLSRQSADEIVLQIAGINTRFATADIERFEALPSLFDRYVQLRDAVGDDPDQIIKLAEWLEGRGKLEWAYSEVQRALKADASHPAALRFRSKLEALITLKRQRQIPDQREVEDDKPETAPKPGLPPEVPFPLLDQEQIELMKVYEVDLSTNPRLIISRDTITRLLEANANHQLVPMTREGRDAIFRKSPAEILDLMFRLQARDFYKEVKVVDPPKPLTTFRDRIARGWLVNSCATNECHGGTDAGRLILSNRRVNSEKSLYTNFLILSRFRTTDGKPLLDFDVPEHSILLQIGLPRGRSRHPHPAVYRGVNSRDAFSPVFQTTDDRAFQDGVNWVKSLYKPRPDYPFQYDALRPLVLPSKPIEPPIDRSPKAPPADPVPDLQPQPAPAPTNPRPTMPMDPGAQPLSPNPAGPAAVPPAQDDPAADPSPAKPASPR